MAYRITVVDALLSNEILKPNLAAGEESRKAR